MMTVVENNCFSNSGSLIRMLAIKNKSIPILPAVTLHETSNNFAYNFAKSSTILKILALAN